MSEHQIDYRESPTHRMAICACGWRTQIRRGNALAVVAQLNARIHRHVEGEDLSRNKKPEPNSHVDEPFRSIINSFARSLG